MKTVLLAGVLLMAGACGKDDQAPTSTQPTGPIEVGAVRIEPQRVVVTTELPGRASAYRIAEVRARVDGIVQRRLHAEGSDVRVGTPLFRIDPEPFEAALQSAEAQLASAQATATSARLLAQRYEQLIETNAISRQEYDDAVAQEKTARANVEAARAAVRAARINLGYTLVRSPISGRTGPSNVTEGAFVRQGEATLLTTVTQLDPIYIDTTWSTLDLMRVRRLMEEGKLVTVEGEPEVTVLLEDGREYPQRGKLLLTGVRVDPTTGSVALRALVPNPDAQLLPGMFVRTRIVEGTLPAALLVPQRGVTRDRNGRPTALVVNARGVVEERQLAVDRAVGDSWLVTEGISPGEYVIVEGVQRVKPGAPVKVVPPSDLRAPLPGEQQPSTSPDATPQASPEPSPRQPSTREPRATRPPQPQARRPSSPSSSSAPQRSSGGRSDGAR